MEQEENMGDTRKNSPVGASKKYNRVFRTEDFPSATSPNFTANSEEHTVVATKLLEEPPGLPKKLRKLRLSQRMEKSKMKRYVLERPSLSMVLKE